MPFDIVKYCKWLSAVFIPSPCVSAYFSHMLQEQHGFCTLKVLPGVLYQNRQRKIVQFLWYMLQLVLLLADLVHVHISRAYNAVQHMVAWPLVILCYNMKLVLCDVDSTGCIIILIVAEWFFSLYMLTVTSV